MASSVAAKTQKGRSRAAPRVLSFASVAKIAVQQTRRTVNWISPGEALPPSAKPRIVLAGQWHEAQTERRGLRYALRTTNWGVSTFIACVFRTASSFSSTISHLSGDLAGLSDSD